MLYGQVFRDGKWCPVKLTETELDLWPLDWFELTLWDLCYFLEFGRIESEIWGGLRFWSCLWVGFSRRNWTGNYGFHTYAKFSCGFSLYLATSARLFRCEFVSG